AGGGLEKLLQHCNGGASESIGRVNTSASLADKRTLQMNSDDFRRETAVFFGLFVIVDVARDSLEAFAGFVNRGGDRRRQHRSGSESRDRGRDFIEGPGIRFHHVVAAGAVNVE